MSQSPTVPRQLLSSVTYAEHESLVTKVLEDHPLAIHAIEEVVHYARDVTDATVSFEILADGDDDGPPISLYLRLSQVNGRFKELDQQLLRWWYEKHDTASTTVLLVVLPGGA